MEFYSEYQNYLDSNSCIENFYYKRKCKERCIDEGIDEKYIEDLSKLYLVCDCLEEIINIKGEEEGRRIINIVSKYIVELSKKIRIDNVEKYMNKLKDKFMCISHITLYAIYMNQWCILKNGCDAMTFKDNIDYDIMKEN